MHGPNVFVALLAAVLASAASSATLEDRSENEKSAIAALHAIHAAQVQYYSQFGRFASSLRQLGERDGRGISTPEAAGLLDSGLASGVKNGYRFALEGRGADAYALSAAPTVFGTAGGRTYYSDQTGAVYEHQGSEPATARDSEVR
jgi:hypothetical protein